MKSLVKWDSADKVQSQVTYMSVTNIIFIRMFWERCQSNIVNDQSRLFEFKSIHTY